MAKKIELEPLEMAYDEHGRLLLPTGEKKIECERRLRREGRFMEADYWRRSRVALWQQGRWATPELRDRSWWEMSLQFPPAGEEQPELMVPDGELPEAEGFDDSGHEEGDFTFYTVSELRGLPAGELRNFARDAEWVYGNISSQEVDPRTAPSVGALGLLDWARRNQKDFYARVLNQVSKVAEQGEKEEEVRKEKTPDEVYAEDIRKLAEGVRKSSGGQ